jgi:organic hydroperoxide reductase OsmC/OhrA
MENAPLGAFSRRTPVSRHGATIAWRSDGQFVSGDYSRRHEWRFDGGAVVAGSSSPTVVPEPRSDAAAVDPEEALVASAASCHMLWFLDLARHAGHEVTAYVDAAEGEMGRTGPGRMAITRIVLRPRIDFAGEPPSPEALARLHHEAHERCFIANSLKAEIVVESAG